MRDIKTYIKTAPNKTESVTTGVNIKKQHRDFIQTNKLNLSEIVRDVLDELMKQDQIKTK